MTVIDSYGGRPQDSQILLLAPSPGGPLIYIERFSGTAKRLQNMRSIWIAGNTIQHQHDYYWFLRQGEIWMTRLITWEWLSEGWKPWQRGWEWKGNLEWSLQSYCTFYDKLIQLKAWNSYLQANISSSRHAVDTITACSYAIPVLYCLCTVNWSKQITSYFRDRLVNWRQEREAREGIGRGNTKGKGSGRRWRKERRREWREREQWGRGTRTKRKIGTAWLYPLNPKFKKHILPTSLQKMCTQRNENQALYSSFN